MTTVSTAVATVMMPFNIFLYTRRWQEADLLHIPYLQIIVTLVVLLIPVAAGMLIRWKRQAAAQQITKVTMGGSQCS